MEHFAQVVDQIDYRIASIKSEVNKTEIHLHTQLNAGVPEEHLSDYFSLLDIEEGKLRGLNEALKILQSAWLDYTEQELEKLRMDTYHELQNEPAELRII